MDKKKLEEWYMSVVTCCLILLLLLCMLAFALFPSENEMIKKYEYLVTEMQEHKERANESFSKIISNLKEINNSLRLENAELKKEIESISREVELPVYSYTKDEIILLAKCVQMEAGSYHNAPNSQRMVAEVILNRVVSSHFPNNIHDVIYQASDGIPQFDVAYNGMIENCVLEPETLNNVYDVFMGERELPESVQFFYAEDVTDNWVNTLEIYKVVEGTVFAHRP